MEPLRLHTKQDLSQKDRFDTSLNLLEKNLRISNHQSIKHRLIFPSQNNKEYRTIDSTTETLLEETGLTQALLSPLTYRDFWQYIEYLNIPLGELGDHILDLGSGGDEDFSKGAAAIGKEVVSVNPKLLEERGRGFVKKDGNWQERSVAALAQNLPFKDNSFDSIVSLFAFPYWVHPTDWKKSLDEIFRVVKPGGKIFLGPMRSSRFNLERFTDLLSNLGVDYDLTDQHCTATKPSLVLTKAVV